jgi:hypothetical protein
MSLLLDILWERGASKPAIRTSDSEIPAQVGREGPFYAQHHDLAAENTFGEASLDLCLIKGKILRFAEVFFALKICRDLLVSHLLRDAIVSRDFSYAIIIRRRARSSIATHPSIRP